MIFTINPARRLLVDLKGFPWRNKLPILKIAQTNRTMLTVTAVKYRRSKRKATNVRTLGRV
jgi:hypothetical protein